MGRFTRQPVRWSVRRVFMAGLTLTPMFFPYRQVHAFLGYPNARNRFTLAHVLRNLSSHAQEVVAVEIVRL